MNKPIVVDETTGQRYWTVTDCADHCGIQPSSWHSYLKKGAPKPIAHLDKRTPLWDPAQVEQWHISRPQKPGRPRKN